MKRVLVHTFGCQMNAHDSRRIEEALAVDGYEPTDLPEHADLIVLNTCSVREKAEHKLVSALGKLRPLKGENPELRIAVAGCMAQEHGPKLLDRLDLVDVMVGPDNIPELPGLVKKAQAGGRYAATTLDEEPRFLTAEPRAHDPITGRATGPEQAIARLQGWRAHAGRWRGETEAVAIKLHKRPILRRYCAAPGATPTSRSSRRSTTRCSCGAVATAA